MLRPRWLDWLDHGCERAERAGITPDRVLNTRAAAGITGR
jgi:putative hydrolase